MQRDIDEDGNVEYCFLTQDGIRSPVLHVYPVCQDSSLAYISVCLSS